jgi:hypothetical protein
VADNDLKILWEEDAKAKEENIGSPDGYELLTSRSGRFTPIVLSHHCFENPVLMNLTKSF